MVKRHVQVVQHRTKLASTSDIGLNSFAIRCFPFESTKHVCMGCLEHRWIFIFYSDCASISRKPFIEGRVTQVHKAVQIAMHRLLDHF